MTRYTINAPDPTTLAIELSDVAGTQDELLEAFGECQEGRCTCPTDEYAKLESMSMEPGDNQIAIHLRAKPGATLDTAEIAACLDYTIGKVKQGQGA